MIELGHCWFIYDFSTKLMTVPNVETVPNCWDIRERTSNCFYYWNFLVIVPTTGSWSGILSISNYFYPRGWGELLILWLVKNSFWYHQLWSRRILARIIRSNIFNSRYNILISIQSIRLAGFNLGSQSKNLSCIFKYFWACSLLPG